MLKLCFKGARRPPAGRSLKDLSGGNGGPQGPSRTKIKLHSAESSDLVGSRRVVLSRFRSPKSSDPVGSTRVVSPLTVDGPLKTFPGTAGDPRARAAQK